MLLKESVRIAFTQLIRNIYFRNGGAEMFNEYTNILIEANNVEANRVVFEILKSNAEDKGVLELDDCIKKFIRVGLGGYKIEKGALPLKYRDEYEKIYGYYKGMLLIIESEMN